MKVILSTSELGNLENVARASLVAMMAGADFIKTSTGVQGDNASLPAGLVMARAIREYRDRTGRIVGFKPAGGIRTAAAALDWIALVRAELGDAWLRAERFRIGASSLLDGILDELGDLADSRQGGETHAPAMSPTRSPTHRTMNRIQTTPRRGSNQEAHALPDSTRGLPRRGITRTRVRYAETDQMGVVYHANYLVWCEIGRTDLIRALGTSYAELERDGLTLAVAEASVRYHRPARYDDAIRIETWIERAQSRGVTFGYEILRESDDESVRLATAMTKLIALDDRGAPRTFPPEILGAFRDAVAKD